MTMDISRLGIEVKSTGIKESSDALGGLSRSAGNAEKRVTALTAAMAGLNGANTGVMGSSNALSGVMGLIASALTQANQNATGLAKALAQVTTNMNQMTGAAQQATTAFDSKSRSGGVVTTTLKAMATAALAYFSIASARNIVEQADSWGMMQAKLKLATGSMQEAREVQGHLFNMSQNMRAPLEDMGKLYTRLAPALGRMGKSAEDTRNMVEGVTLALKLGGATSGEAASTMLQFSQAANAGRLNGAEFNSVAENGVVILRALEDHLGKNQAELKKMGAEGTLTFDLISEALEKQLPKWREDFKSLPVTFEGAMQRIRNAWFKAIGEAGQETELGKKLAEGLLKLEAEIPRIAEAVVGAFNFMIDHGGKLVTMFGLLAGVGIAKWATDAVLGFTALATTMRAAGGAAVLLRTGLSFMAGPVGILTGLIMAGTTAWMMYGDKGKTASANLTTKTVQDTETRINEINREIRKLNERNAAAGAPAAGPKADKQSDTVMESLQTLQKLRATYFDPKTNEATKTALKIAIDLKQTEFERLMSGEQALKMTQAHSLAMEKQKKVAEMAAEDRAKFATGEKKALIEIEEAKKRYAAEGGELPKDIEAAIREKHTKGNAKAAREEASAVKEAHSELEKQALAYKEVRAAFEQLKASGESDDKRTAIQKDGARLADELARASSKAQRALLEQAIAQNNLARGVEMQMVADREMMKTREDYQKAQEASIGTAEKELLQLRDKIAGYGQAKGAVESLAIAEAEAKLAAMQTMSLDGQDPEIERQKRLLEVLREVATAKAELGQLDALDKLDKALDVGKIADFGNAFGEAFGKIGKAIDKGGKALDNFKKAQIANEKLRDKANNVKDDKAYFAAMEVYRINAVKSEVDMYGDMAGAAKGFFKEKTVAYKLFDAIETGMRVAQIALTWQKMAAEVTAEKVRIAAKTAATGAAIALDTTETTSSVSNSLTRAGASLTAGIAKAFEQLGVWGFVGAAAMIAFMASVGFSGGGGGGSGPPVHEERQKTQGTGTVFGDDEAKSESILNALEIMRDNSNIGLRATSAMLVSLRNIEMSMSGLTNAILRVSGMTTGKNFGINEGSTDGKSLLDPLGIFGSKTTTKLVDTGLVIKGIVAELLNGEGLQQYADVQRTKKRWYGGTKTSNSREFMSVDERLAEHVGSVFAEINATIEQAAVSLGGNGASIRAALEAFVIDTEVSFKDLKGQDLQDALNAVFSGAADDMAASIFPGLEQFQRVGEGYFETLTRVATSTERAKDALSKLGVDMVSLTSITNKTGDVGVELIRESLLAGEGDASLREVLRVLDGTMDDLIDGYRTLTRLRAQLAGVGISGSMSLDLIRGAGGLAELDDAFSQFFEGFFSDSERNAMAMSQLRMEFGRLGREMPASKEAFRALVTTMMAGDAASQELAGRLLALSGLFAEAFEDGTAQQAERISTAKDVLSEAYDRESEALENIKEKMTGFAESLKNFRDSLIMGDASPLSALEKYQTALARYNDVSARARNGDETAIGQYERTAQELLNFSREVNASGSAYTADFERVLRESEALQGYTESQADVATRSLDALKEQVGVLLTIDESVKTVAQAIADLRIVMAGGTLPVDGSHANGLANVPFDGYVAELHKGERVLTAGENQEYKFNYANYGRKSDESLVNEIKTLRQELVALRQEQREQTGSLIASNYDANERNADAVVAGTREAAADAAYATRAPIGLS